LLSDRQAGRRLRRSRFRCHKARARQSGLSKAGRALVIETRSMEEVMPILDCRFALCRPRVSPRPQLHKLTVPPVGAVQVVDYSASRPSRRRSYDQ